jgi:hypothetical protein
VLDIVPKGKTADLAMNPRSYPKMMQVMEKKNHSKTRQVKRHLWFAGHRDEAHQAGED